MARRWLILACCLAVVPVLWRGSGALREIRTEQRATAAFQNGLRLQATGRYEDAARIFREVLGIWPSSSAALVSLAETEFRLGRVEEAVNAYRQLLGAYPYTYMGSIYRDLAVVELHGGRSEDAVEDLRKAVEYEPEDWFAHYLLGEAFFREGDHKAARAAWVRTLRLNPTFRPVRDRLQNLGKFQ